MTKAELLIAALRFLGFDVNYAQPLSLARAGSAPPVLTTNVRVLNVRPSFPGFATPTSYGALADWATWSNGLTNLASKNPYSNSGFMGVWADATAAGEYPAECLALGTTAVPTLPGTYPGSYEVGLTVLHVPANPIRAAFMRSFIGTNLYRLVLTPPPPPVGQTQQTFLPSGSGAMSCLLRVTRAAGVVYTMSWTLTFSTSDISRPIEVYMPVYVDVAGKGEFSSILIDLASSPTAAFGSVAGDLIEVQFESNVFSQYSIFVEPAKPSHPYVQGLLAVLLKHK